MLSPAWCVLRAWEGPTRMSRVPRATLGPQPGQGGRVQLSTGHSSCCPNALCDTGLYPSLHPTAFLGVQPHRGNCQSPQPAEAVGRQAEHGQGGLAACPHPACASGSSLSRHRTRHPGTQIPQLPWDEDKGLKRRPPPPRWPGRRMSSDISQSSVQKYTGTGFIPPASPATHRRESGRGFAITTAFPTPQLGSDDKQNPDPSAPHPSLPCRDPLKALLAVSGRRGEQEPGCLSPCWHSTTLPWPGTPGAVQAQLHRATSEG